MSDFNVTLARNTANTGRGSDMTCALHAACDEIECLRTRIAELKAERDWLYYGWTSPRKQDATHDDKKWLDLIRKELFHQMDLASTPKSQRNASFRIDAFDHLRDRCAYLEGQLNHTNTEDVSDDT